MVFELLVERLEYVPTRYFIRLVDYYQVYLNLNLGFLLSANVYWWSRRWISCCTLWDSKQDTYIFSMPRSVLVDRTAKAWWSCLLACAPSSSSSLVPCSGGCLIYMLLLIVYPQHVRSDNKQVRASRVCYSFNVLEFTSPTLLLQ